MTNRPPPEPPGEPGGNRVDPMLEVRERSVGARPGDAYVRIVRPFESEFEHGDEGQLIASERTIDSTTTFGRWFRGGRNFLFGRPISSEHEEHERLTKIKALAVFSSDNISSSAYATEEIMRILILAGVGAIALTLPITVAIVAVLVIVAVSYRQTIRAYPNGASSYIVASDNLGTGAGLLAGGALLIDYTLTVAVSVSAGVAAITSLVPSLYPERVLIGLIIVALLTIGNLRGIRESGTIFMAPTYLYLVVIFGVIAWGLFLQASGNLGTFVPPPEWMEAPADTATVLSVFLVLRAFSSGSAALTGIEAVSDGVPAFKPPEWRNARTTLTWAAILFGALFLGISYLAAVIQVVPDPTEQQTVLSLITRQVVGDGWYLVVVQIATALVLTLAANTAFADFPRLSSFLARDGFMPRQFGFRGDRLAFTTGIAALAGMASVLLVVFDASVTALIPLYTLGVFLAFTLSQSGMVVRWWRRREPKWRSGLIINGVGAVTTAVIAVVVVSTKFLSGAWIVVLLIPVLMALMLAIRRHYRRVEVALTPVPSDLRLASAPPMPIVIVPIARLDRPALGALAFARTLSPQASAVHVTNDAAMAELLREQWAGLDNGMELVVVESPYRALMGPLLRYMDALQALDPSRPVVVVLSEIVPRHWWENLLHNQSSLRLKLRLFGRRNTIVADVPYHLD